MMRAPKRKPSQAVVVGAFIGTLQLLESEISWLPHSVLADVAARLVPLMDFEQPLFTILSHEPKVENPDVQPKR
jgi:hypothetical protein